MNNQLNFDRPKGLRNLEAGGSCARNTKKGSMEKMGLDLGLKAMEASGAKLQRQ